ncbi:hypothetical protein BGZ49_009980 [Haplosporangium sp. Z 27]|nr:hypothetical protein BGZ49_009980 [Haplosporangium sp. Z 27]
MDTIDFIFNALEAYEHKSGCFKNAARALRQNCKHIDIDSDEKTKYAIRLTTCEIATANMPVPAECHNINSLDENSNQKDNEIANAEIGGCVQSLGRIPQLWTSYSGYFREVKVMCLAVRHFIEHDNFRILQRNMTRYHAEQIDLLRKHQNELMEKHRLETERLQEVLNVHSTIIREMKSVESLVGSFHHSLSSVIDNISSLKQKSEEIVQQNVALSNFQGMEMSLLAERHSELEVIDNSNNSGVARIASSRPNIRPRVDWTKSRTYGNFIIMLRT